MAVLINNTDIATAYGAIIVNKGYNGLIEWPSAKPVDSNNWHESDGIEADLSSLKLASHRFTMQFGLKYSSPSQVESFYHFLNSSPTLTFSSTDAAVSRTLRVEGMQSLRCAKTFSVFGVKLSCDEDILSGYTRVAPVAGLCPEDAGFKIDGVKISDYGVMVLDGTMASILKQGDVKKSLCRDMSTINGSEYDLNPLLWNGSEWARSSSKDTVHYDSVQVILACGMIAPDLDTAWRNYTVLLYDLIHADADADELDACRRHLYVGTLDKTFNCYYREQSVREFSFNGGRVWLKFDITLEVIN